MPSVEHEQPLSSDASELILCTDTHIACETYIFEPGDQERALGSLFAVGETEDREGVGRELLDLTIQALQREYFRDPQRTILASFESALHQANLVLHDTAESGVRDWMGYFNVAISVIANTTMHISTAGRASIFLSRRARTTLVSKDLAHSPITNPLRTFSQVASGVVAARDIIYLGSARFTELFRPEDLARFAIDHSSSIITTRLQQLYADRQATLPLSSMVISLLPHYVATPATIEHEVAHPRRQRGVTGLSAPRQPLIIHRSWLRAILAIVGRMVASVGAAARQRLWPAVVKSSRAGSRAVAQVSVATSRNVHNLTRRGLNTWRARDEEAAETVTAVPPTRRFDALQLVQPLKELPTWPRRAWTSLRGSIIALPRTSKIFAVVTVILALALVTSLVLLRHKRAEDAAIQRASELLHQAQTKRAAAEAALLYDRSQSDTLLQEAQADLTQLEQSGFYVDETHTLAQQLAVAHDRLQKITRASAGQIQIVGDFASVLEGAEPTLLTFVNDTLYTFHPTSNAILSMDSTGRATVASTAANNLGTVRLVVPQIADKLMYLLTNKPSLAVLDARENTVQPKEITMPSAAPTGLALGIFGNRLYMYDRTAANIYGYSSTLTGYSGGKPWITDGDFPIKTIVDLAIDGNIFTLHEDGTVRKLFKGAEEDFKLEAIDPPLRGTKIIASDTLKNLYIFDPTEKRLVVFTKKGMLVQQIFLDVATKLHDVAVSPDETKIYVLDGTRVLTVPNPS